MQKFRKYIAVLLLLLFVFPFVQKAMHDIKHRKDFHCFVLTAIHFHKKEHICGICDFAFPDSKIPIENNNNRALFSCIDYYSMFTEGFNFVSPYYLFSTKAPPSLLEF